VIEFYRVAFNKKFKDWDEVNSGALSFDEVKRILQQDNYDDEKIERMYKQCDKDGDGKVTCEEFLKLM
jgi:Ca2+-binding EF-hand superfamily protein